MANPLFSRAARAFVAGTLALSLGLAPAFAHMPLRGGPAGHAAIGPIHGARPAQRGWSRYGRDREGWSGERGFSWNGQRGYRWNGRGRYGWNGWGANPGLWGVGSLGVWDGWGAPESPPAAPAFALGGDGPPAAVTVIAPGPVAGPGEYGGGCVIHQLRYDRTGNFIGERQYSNC